MSIRVLEVCLEFLIFCLFAPSQTQPSTHTQLGSTWDPRDEANQHMNESDCPCADDYDCILTFDFGGEIAGPHNVSKVLVIFPMMNTNLSLINIHVSYGYFTLFMSVSSVVI